MTVKEKGDDFFLPGISIISSDLTIKFSHLNFLFLLALAKQLCTIELLI